MKTFTLIDGSNSSHRAMTAYRFAGERIIDHEAYSRIFSDLNAYELDNRISRDADSFYDGWEDVCTDENGELYLVSFWWETHEPLMWCRIEKEV